MAAVKKKKILMFKGKPLHRVGDRIYYGNLEDPIILVLDILNKNTVAGKEIASQITVKIIDNTGKLGEGAVYRKSERSNMYKALDIGSWWLKDALDSMAMAQ